MVLVQQPQHRFCPHHSSKLLPRLHPPPITSKAPTSPYKGSAYRSIAFGTWAVGDASRRIGERKRGKSATAQEGKANAKKEEGNHRQQKRRSTSPSPPSASSGQPPSSSSSPRQILSLSLGDLPGRIGTPKTHRRKGTGAMERKLRKGADLYSSREYVRHNFGGGGGGHGANANFENVSLSRCSASASAPVHCSLDTLFLPPASASASLCAPSPRPFARLGPTSCPPPPSLLRHPPPPFAFIVDPLAAKRGQMLRNRTKSLDNVQSKKFPLGARRRNDRVRAPAEDSDCASEAVYSARVARDSGDQNTPNGGGESRLDTAKNFLRRFYAQSTLRLTGRRRRKRVAGATEAEGPYSSAMGPFFEMRKPHPEEVPYLPYNIHYTIESSDGASDGSEYEHGEERTDQTQSDRRLLETPTGWSSTTTPTLCSSTAMTAGNCLVSGNFIEQITTPAGPRPPPTSPPSFDLSELFARSLAMTTASSCFDSSSSSSPSQQHLPLPLPPSATTTPSAGYGSLGSSDSEAKQYGENSEDNGGRDQQQMGPAERRFAEWNELFQYLKREIMEMNVRDTQILHRLKGIQQELNGVRQMANHRR